MKHLMKRQIAKRLQILLRQPWIRKAGQNLSKRMPWIKQSILRLLYNTPRQQAPDKLLHQGPQEARIDAAIKQRITGFSQK